MRWCERTPFMAAVPLPSLRTVASPEANKDFLSTTSHFVFRSRGPDHRTIIEIISSPVSIISRARRYRKVRLRLPSVAGGVLVRWFIV